jgi:hypothetical protein
MHFNLLFIALNHGLWLPIVTCPRTNWPNFATSILLQNMANLMDFFEKKNPLGPFFMSFFCVAKWQFIFATKKIHIDDSNKCFLLFTKILCMNPIRIFHFLVAKWQKFIQTKTLGHLGGGGIISIAMLWKVANKYRRMHNVLKISDLPYIQVWLYIIVEDFHFCYVTKLKKKT